MKPERNQQIDQLFQAALACDPADRTAFLDQACANDVALRREVEGLLASDEQASGFIESPALEMAPEVVAGDRSKTVSGKTIGPYRLDQRIGSGGMGKVYLAHDIRLGRKVALKLLDPRLLDDTEQRTRFLREARLASVLDHPNICTIHQVGEAGGRLFIAMQYVEGQTLKQVINGRPLSLDCLLSISLQVADALSAAHAQDIIHRDIKAGNIIVTPRGQAKVLDFGLAKLLEKAEGEETSIDLTMTGAVMGTPSSMSPEQARGERTDHRSDIFSFGVVIYEMATGQSPFKGKTRADVLNTLLNQSHAPAMVLNKEIPAKLSAIIDHALAKEPADRYQSMPEMVAELQQVVAEAGGMDRLFSSSEARFRVMTPYVAPGRQGLIKVFGRKIQTRIAVALLTVVVVASLAGLAIVVYRSWSKPSLPTTQSQSALPPAAASIKSIAVLPFKPLAEKSRDEVLEIGMADTLINRLSGMKEVIVRPISAVRKYTGLEQDALAAGQEQRVDAVLDGSIHRSADKVRVTVRLVKVEDGSQLWGETFNEKFTDIFAVQDRVSEKVASLLAVKLTGAEQVLLTKRYTDNAEAYELYLKGAYFKSKVTEEGMQKAIEYFQRAIAVDPNYAQAYADLGDTYLALGSVWGFRSPQEILPKAKEALMKALEIDETLADAHYTLASYKLGHEWNWAEGEREFKRTLELNPNHAWAHSQYGGLFQKMGRFDEALAERKLAQKLDPLSPTHTANVGYPLYYARRHDEAIEHYRKALELDQNYYWGHLWIGQAYVAKGLYQEGIAEINQAITLSGGDIRAIATLGHAFAVAGKRDEAQKVLDDLKELSKRKYVAPYFIAVIYTGLGEKDQAFRWLEKAFQERHPFMTLIKVEPVFDPLRSDPRFNDLLRRIGLSQ